MLYTSVALFRLQGGGGASSGRAGGANKKRPGARGKLVAPEESEEDSSEGMQGRGYTPSRLLIVFCSNGPRRYIPLG